MNGNEKQIRHLLDRPIFQADLKGCFDHETVLITGGAGSIGLAVAKRLVDSGCQDVVLMDRSETALAKAQRQNLNCLLELADVTRKYQIKRIMDKYRPSVVIHAASHQHVSFMEDSVEEAYDNNYVGTVNMVEAAQCGQVEQFVFISTDKAVDPSCVMGLSKRMAERYIQQQKGLIRYAIVRFGNVLDSTGSILEIWREQIERGNPLEVTDFRMTRYLMTLGEAADLVLTACLESEGNETFVLNMGEPVRIVDLARRFNVENKRDADSFVIRGIRPGEKLVEQLHSESEELEATRHGAIWRVVPTQSNKPPTERENHESRKNYQPV